MTFWIAWDRVTNQLNDCLIPCAALKAAVSGKNVKDNNKTYGESYFYFAPRLGRQTICQEPETYINADNFQLGRIMSSKEHIFYTFLSMMAEIGGYVGLLLGVSFFHFAAWLSTIIDKKILTLEHTEGEYEEGTSVHGKA